MYLNNHQIECKCCGKMIDLSFTTSTKWKYKKKGNYCCSYKCFSKAERK